MLIQVMRAKIHRVRVTQADLNYVGSIAIDEELMRAAGIYEHERVQVVNVNNGERLETYVIKAPAGSGTISLNGPAARKCQVGDIVIIVAYGWIAPDEAAKHTPTVIFPDADNRV